MMSDAIPGLRYWVRNNLSDGSPEQRGLLAALEVVEASGAAAYIQTYDLGDEDVRQRLLQTLERFEEEAGE